MRVAVHVANGLLLRRRGRHDVQEASRDIVRVRNVEHFLLVDVSFEEARRDMSHYDHLKLQKIQNRAVKKARGQSREIVRNRAAKNHVVTTHVFVLSAVIELLLEPRKLTAGVVVVELHTVVGVQVRVEDEKLELDTLNKQLG